MLRNTFKKTYTKIDTKYKQTGGLGEEPVIPEGLWCKCNRCGQSIYMEDVKNNYYVRPKCSGYFRVHAYRRIEMPVDEGTFEEWNKEMSSSNPLESLGYEKKVLAAREKSRPNEVIVIGKGLIDGNPAVIGVCDARFIMSSMGHMVGEKVTDAVERVTKEKLPVIIFACSGGARMQEGIVSLMQMVKTSTALKRHHDAGQLFISVLMDSTTGGVTISSAMLGDIIPTEPHVLIGFAESRVIEQTIEQKLLEGLRRSGFLLNHGFVDKIVEREDQKRVVRQIPYIHRSHKMNIQIPVDRNHVGVGKSTENSGDSGKTTWDTALFSRKLDRSVVANYINVIFGEFIEFHGDCYSGNDGVVMGGIAMLHGMPVTVIGQQKDKNIKESLKRNFGMPSPDGYREALRLMKQAETFERPIICFVDMPGAFCGLEAEERGQGEAIARNLFEMSSPKVPVLSVAIGEGGNGGALVMAVVDEVWMLENATYSILSPEGLASILYKDSKKVSDAAKVVKVIAQDLRKLGLIKRIVPEEEPACADNLYHVAEFMDSAMAEFFESYLAMLGEELTEHRYQRSRRM